jgi:hypothetical protein
MPRLPCMKRFPAQLGLAGLRPPDGRPPRLLRKSAQKPQKTTDSGLALRESGESIFCDLPERAYRIRCFQKNTTVGRIQVQLRLSAADEFHQDMVDLCSHRQRKAFAAAAASECKLACDVITGDLKRLLCALEAKQDAIIAAKDAPSSPVSPAAGLSDDDRESALRALKSPTLLADIANDLRACGLVGEDMNGLAAYLVATSRLLDAPLGGIIQASSSAGNGSALLFGARSGGPADHDHARR